MLELRTMSDGMGHRLTGRPLRQTNQRVAREIAQPVVLSGTEFPISGVQATRRSSHPTRTSPVDKAVPHTITSPQPTIQAVMRSSRNTAP